MEGTDWSCWKARKIVEEQKGEVVGQRERKAGESGVDAEIRKERWYGLQVVQGNNRVDIHIG